MFLKKMTIDSTEDLVDVKDIYDNGIFHLGNHQYSKTWAIEDINYLLAPDETLKEYAESWSSFVKGLSHTISWKLSLHKYSVDVDKLKAALSIPEQGELAEYIADYNELVMSVAAKNGDNTRVDIYITGTLWADNYTTAQREFLNAETTLNINLAELCNRNGGRCTPLLAARRAELLHKLLRPNDTDVFSDAFIKNEKGECDVSLLKKYLCPDSLEFPNKETLLFGNKIIQTLYAKAYETYLDIDILTRLVNVPCDTFVTLDMIPLGQDKSLKYVEEKQMIADANVQRYVERATTRKSAALYIPPDEKNDQEACSEIYNDCKNNDQTIIRGMLSVVLFSDNERQHQDNISALKTAGKGIQFATLARKQIDSLISALPLGHNKVPLMRPFTSGALAGFAPFNMREIYDDKGLFLGVNAVTQNVLRVDPGKLQNSNMWVFGVPGSGKSVQAKMIMLSTVFTSSGEVLICDPEGEYTKLLEPLGATIIKVSPQSNYHFNMLALGEAVEDDDLYSPITNKVELVAAVCENFAERRITGSELSLLDRTLQKLYDTLEEPTLADLYNELRQEKTIVAEELANILEIYAVGSLNVFSHKTSVDVNAPVVVYDLSAMTDKLRLVAEIVVTDYMVSRVTKNWKSSEKRKTRIFIDEFAKFAESEKTLKWVENAWRTFRKRGAIPCGITQNVSAIVKNESIAEMLANSEIVIMLNQGTTDRAVLSELYGLDDTLLSFITNADVGCGLLRFGKTVVPFEFKIPLEAQEKSEIFKLINTKR